MKTTLLATEAAKKRRIRLVAVAVICAAALLPAIVVWLVNLQIAITSIAPTTACSQLPIQEGIGRLLEALSGDLSTISTLIPLLLLLFPLLQALRILRRCVNSEAEIHELTDLPYPAHFPFFLVMLGLAGTLYGLWMGLSVSGVTSMTQGIADPDELPATLDRLLDGTATALLSSLVGLIGAFLAARPLTMLFAWAACLDPAEEERTLEETIDTLTRDLKSLSAASRTATEALRPEPLTEALESIHELHRITQVQTTAIQANSSHLEAIAQGLETIRDAMSAMPAIQDATVQTATQTAQLPALLQEMLNCQRDSSSQLTAMLTDLQQERNTTATQLRDIRSEISASDKATRTARSRVLRACSAFLKDTPDEG